jgi:hypothetical protein
MVQMRCGCLHLPSTCSYICLSSCNTGNPWRTGSSHSELPAPPWTPPPPLLSPSGPASLPLPLPSCSRVPQDVGDAVQELRQVPDLLAAREAGRDAAQAGQVLRSDLFVWGEGGSSRQRKGCRRKTWGSACAQPQPSLLCLDHPELLQHLKAQAQGGANQAGPAWPPLCTTPGCCCLGERTTFCA